MTPSFALAQQLPVRDSWAPVIMLVIIGLLFVAGTVVLSALIGPGRTGPGKATTYESGMNPVGDTRKRFNVRFYIVAMIFLVFDVEIVFFYPFATIFAPFVRDRHAEAGVILVSMLVFIGILLLAYIYAWGKGVFRWD